MLGERLQRLGDARLYNGKRLPPGPAEPAALQTLQWILRPLDYLERARARFGKVFTSRLVGFPPLVHFTDPEAIREIFTGPPDALHAGEANAILEPILGTFSLLTLDREPHLRQRRLLLPPFHGQRMQAYGAVMRQITELSLERWPRGAPFRLHERARSIALEVILRTVFGLQGDGEARRIGGELTELFDLAEKNPLLLLPFAQADLGPLSPWGRFVRRMQSIDGRLFELIAARRREADAGARRERDDVLSLLIEARDEDGRPMSARELRDELMTLLVAGHDTVATGLSWTIHHLIENPHALEHAYNEVDRASGAADGGCADLPWLDAVIKESLRLTPVLPIVGRRLQRDMRIGGIDLPAGVRAAPNVYLTHRDPDCFARPERFDPERFLDARLNPYAYFPFGGGVRRCIGMAFALYEMRVVLATVLRRLWLRRAPGAKVRAVRHGVALAPSRGMPIVVSSR